MAVAKAEPVTLKNLIAKEAGVGDIKQYSTIPVIVEAVSFQGWENAAAIHSWSTGALFVPEGYEHVLRTGEEFDNDGQLLPAASEFLVLKGEAGKETRVDVGDWIVKSTDGKCYVYSDESFKQYYSSPMY